MLHSHYEFCVVPRLADDCADRDGQADGQGQTVCSGSTAAANDPVQTSWISAVTNSSAPTRNTDRTRRALLDSGARLLTTRGLATTLAEVASEAGVSKSGLLHHFTTRDDLFLAVVTDSLERFRSEIVRFVDLSENRPGKGLRAYVRALCGGSPEAMKIFAGEFCGPVDAIPGASEALSADNEMWREFFARDGLHQDRILVVRHAVEGLAVAAFYDETYDARALAHAREVFFDLIDDESWRPRPTSSGSR